MPSNIKETEVQILAFNGEKMSIVGKLETSFNYDHKDLDLVCKNIIGIQLADKWS